MKGGFETSLTIFFGMMFILVGFSMSLIAIHYHNARVFQEAIVVTIERQDRYDEQVEELISSSAYTCLDCTYQIVKEEERYKVTVFFPIQIPVIKSQMIGKVVSFTQPIS